MKQTFLEMMLADKSRQELTVITKCNQISKTFGLELSESAAQELMLSRSQSLKNQQRVEFGSGILKNLIFTFCDSPYIQQDTYADTLEALQDIFYILKNETRDQVNDEELLAAMKYCFDSCCDEGCGGDTDSLAETVLVQLGYL